jgi:cytochrome c nitrite reductase small subunit
MKLSLVIGNLALLVVVGTGMYVSDFTAYLGDDPTTCNNCHVMDSVYEGWFHAPHKQWASCNDCHTPSDLIHKLLTKSRSGFRHVSAFTLGNIPEAIRAIEGSREIIQQNCIRCHAETVSDIAIGQQKDVERYCFECHRYVAHGERGISILPYKDTTGR